MSKINFSKPFPVEKVSQILQIHMQLIIQLPFDNYYINAPALMSLRVFLLHGQHTSTYAPQTEKHVYAYGLPW